MHGMTEKEFKGFSANLVKHVNSFRDHVNGLDPTGDYLESLVASAFTDSGYEVDWVPRSHREHDIFLTTPAGVRSVSVKTGSVSSRDKVQVSSFRLGDSFRVGGLSEALKDIKSRTSDILILVPSGMKSTKVLMLSTPIELGKESDWVVSKSSSGAKVWTFTGPKVKALIRESMSHQLWLTYDVDNFSIYTAGVSTNDQ